MPSLGSMGGGNRRQSELGCCMNELRECIGPEILLGQGHGTGGQISHLLHGPTDRSPGS